jgi:hypothetical protein
VHYEAGWDARRTLPEAELFCGAETKVAKSPEAIVAHSTSHMT